MMLPAQGPDTSLMEDLVHLGLAEGKDKADKADKAANNDKGDGYAKPDAKGGDYVGPDSGDEGDAKEDDYMVDVGDEAGGTRKNVPVRADGDVGPSEKRPAKAEDVESDTDRTTTKLVPNFMIPTEQEVVEAEQKSAEDAERAKLERAWDVVHAYFSESNDELNEQGLRGVINAMGHALDVAVEDVANLVAENSRLNEAVAELTGLLSEAEAEMDADKADKADDADDDEADDKADADADKAGEADDKADDKADDEDDKVAKKMAALRAAKAAKAAKPQDAGMAAESRNKGANLTESADDLTSLLDEIRGIGNDRETRAVDKQAKLVEGFEAVRDGCRAIVDRIVEVMREDAGVAEDEDLEVDEDNQQYSVATHFESIADDAEKYLSRLADGNVPFKVAEADLAKLHTDMEKGLAAMETIK